VVEQDASDEVEGEEGFDEKLFGNESATRGGDRGQAGREEDEVVVRGGNEKGTRGGELNVEGNDESSSILSSELPVSPSISSPREFRRIVG
jgi:hypothetical protein